MFNLYYFRFRVIFYPSLLTFFCDLLKEELLEIWNGDDDEGSVEGDLLHRLQFDFFFLLLSQKNKGIGFIFQSSYFLSFSLFASSYKGCLFPWVYYSHCFLFIRSLKEWTPVFFKLKFLLLSTWKCFTGGYWSYLDEC